MTKRTYRDILQFLNASSVWLTRHKEPSKFGYALAKAQRKLAKARESYSDAVEDINIQHCSVDEKGNIVHHEQLGSPGEVSYVFTKEEHLKRNAGVRALLDKDVDIGEPYFAPPDSVPPDLSDDMRLVFEGFVIKEEEEPS